MKVSKTFKQKTLGEALAEEGFSPSGDPRLIVWHGPPRNLLHIAFVPGHLRDQIAAAADRYEELAADLRRVLKAGYLKLRDDTPLVDNFIFARRRVTCLKGTAVGHPSLDAMIVDDNEWPSVDKFGRWASRAPKVVGTDRGSAWSLPILPRSQFATSSVAEMSATLRLGAVRHRIADPRNSKSGECDGDAG